MSKKLFIGFIKSEFEEEGYILLSGKCKNSKQKLNYICPKGHKHQISWNAWQCGHRCPYCVGVGKPSIEVIRSEFEKEGYTLLTKVYKNNLQRLDYICPEGHKHSIGWKNWRKGKRCSYCNGRPIITLEIVRQAMVKEGYILLSKVYKNNHSKLKYICPKGHKYSIDWSNWRQGYRCPCCANNNRLTVEFIRAEFEKEGYELLTKIYENSKRKLEYICPKGHQCNISWSNWKKGRRCGVCKVFGGSGSQHGCWKGGISCEPYCQDWTKEFKELIKQRDGYKCLNPDCWKTSKKLTVHHINYNKKDCRKENLITVCRGCNSRANFDREWYEAWYKAILYRRYEYKY